MVLSPVGRFRKDLGEKKENLPTSPQKNQEKIHEFSKAPAPPQPKKPPPHQPKKRAAEELFRSPDRSRLTRRGGSREESLSRLREAAGERIINTLSPQGRLRPRASKEDEGTLTANYMRELKEKKRETPPDRESSMLRRSDPRRRREICARASNGVQENRWVPSRRQTSERKRRETTTKGEK